MSPHAFDVARFHAALDQRRIANGSTWTAVAREIWDLSADLNAQRPSDHPIARSTIADIPRRGDTSCQHAVAFLRWLDRAPEDFIAEPRAGTAGVRLPAADPAHRLRWDLPALYAALDERRTERGATWAATGERLHCTPGRLAALRTARFATSMRFAMRICQGLGRPAADFVRPAAW